MEACKVEACLRPVDRDGVCFPHKVGSIRMGGLHRLRKEREGGYTQAALGRETVQAAKADGKDIMQVRGRAAPTEKLRNGVWEKV